MKEISKYEFIINKYFIPITNQKLKEWWTEPHRVYHDISHLKNIIKELELKASGKVHQLEFEALIIAAFFHDAYYAIDDNYNEEKSYDLFLKYLTPDVMNSQMNKKIHDLIICTKYRKRPIDLLSRVFWEADNAGFYKSLNHYKKVEQQIRDEFSEYSDEQYKEGRLKFLKSCLNLFNGNVDNNLRLLIKYVEQKYN